MDGVGAERDHGGGEVTPRHGLLALLLVAALAAPAAAQWSAQRSTGTISTAGADCAAATACEVLADADAFRRLNHTLQLAGTFTGTAQFEGSGDATTWGALACTPLAGGAAVTSATVPGIWTCTASLQGLRVRASALASGTIAVTILSR